MTSTLFDIAKGAATDVATATAKTTQPVRQAATQAVAPVTPTLAPVGGPPEPLFQRLGAPAPMSVPEFNQRLQTVTDQHVAQFGVKPKPVDALNAVFQPGPIAALPKPAPTPAEKALAAYPLEPGQAFVTRSDGVSQPDHPFLGLTTVAPDKLAAVLAHERTATTGPAVTAALHKPNPSGQAGFLKQYPMTEMGILPIPSFDKFVSALNYLNAPSTKAPPIAPSGYQAPGDQAEQQYDYQLQQYQAGQRNQVTTIKQAQTELNAQMGTSLPETGTWNTTWQSALGNWMKTVDYQQKTLAYQAQSAGFGSNIAGYVKAWNAKQAAMRHGLTGWFSAAMPLGLFGHGSVLDDVASIPGYLKGSSNNPLNIGLHGLTRSAGLTVDVIGGSVNQAKADLAAGNELVQRLAPKQYGGNNETFEQALAHARTILHQQPTWLRIFDPALGQNKDSPRWLKALDQATNLAGDLILLRKPAFTGESIGAGDVAAAADSPYIKAVSRFAYADIAAGNTARAAQILEGGSGAEKLVAGVEKSGKDLRGVVTQQEFRQHVAELYATGRTTLPDGTEVEGPLLGSLRTRNLPTPGVPGRLWIATKRNLRDFGDRYDGTLRDANARLDSHAVSFAQSLGNTLRSSVAHAAPRSARGYFDPGLPEGIRNFVTKYLADPQLGEQLASEAVRLRATGNIEGLQKLEQHLEDLYTAKFPEKGIAAGGGRTPFEAVLDTEAPNVFHFPQGGRKPITGDAIDRLAARWSNRAVAVNERLNKLGRLHSLAILSTGFSLAYKHMSDILRRAVAEDGSVVGPTISATERADLNAALADPQISRAVGSYLERNKAGETRWMLRRSGRNIDSINYTTGDHFADGKHMNGAGGYLRRRLDSDALDAYRASTPDDLRPLAKVILNNDFFRSRFFKEMGDEVAAAREARDAGQLTIGDIPHSADRVTEYNRAVFSLAQDYAPKIAHEFKEFENAAVKAGVQDPWGEAAKVLHANRGEAADKALGQWIAEHHIDFPVRGGLVENVGRFDDVMSRWVGLLMTANKWNRGKLAQREFERKFADLREAGFDHTTAAAVAMDVGEKLVKYHMLDFSNRLQIEQDLRWLSYFATKHRLYWKWVLGLMIRRPFAAAAVKDVEQHLDGRGNINFELAGHRFELPAARLVWVPGQEYDETSPLALAAAGFARGVAKTGNVGAGITQALNSVGGTYGNVFTRLDETVNLGARLAAVYTGAVPATYGLALNGLPTSTRDAVQYEINAFQSRYFREHGHYASEADAVKYALLNETARTFWQAGMPLPVIPMSPQDPLSKQIQQFGALTDPAKRRAFLNKNPQVAAAFGIWGDPKQYIYARTYWARFNVIDAELQRERGQLLAQAHKTGWTGEIDRQYRQASARFSKAYDTLLLDDARATGQVVDGQIVKPGVWGATANTDQMIHARANLTKAFPNLAKNQLDTRVPGPIIENLQAELKTIETILAHSKSPEYAPLAQDLPTLKTRRNDIIGQIRDFEAFPSSAAAKTRAAYQATSVDPYWKWEEAAYAKIAKLPRDQQSPAWAKFQAARDERDHPVTVDGVKFPSPVRMAWAQLDPVTRQQRLAKLAASDYSHLTSYELDLLGVQHPEHITTAIAAIDQAKADYQRANPGHSISAAQLLDVAKQVNRTPGYQGFLSYYVNTLTQPKVIRFEQTSLYRNMPPDMRAGFYQIASQAKQFVRLIAKDGHASYYEAEWRQAVETQVVPWLNDPANRALRAYLAPFGPDFLNTLVTR